MAGQSKASFGHISVPPNSALEVALKKKVYISLAQDQLSENLRRELGCEFLVQEHLTTTGCMSSEGNKEFRGTKLQSTL